MRTTLTIDGMTCGHCVKAVTEALRALPGARDVEVAVGRASFTSDAPPDESAVRAAIDEAGYSVTGLSRA
jgi:copper chaperone CopZ